MKRDTFDFGNRTEPVRFLILPLLYIILLCTAIPIKAQETPVEHTGTKTSAPLPDNAGEKEFLAAAALDNPGLKAAFHHWRAALERVPQVKALPDPQITFAAFVRQIETRVGPQNMKIGLMQKFPWFGKLKLKGSAAARAAEAARQQYEALKDQLFFRVKNAYVDLYWTYRKIDILEENQQLLTLLEEVLRTKYRTGAASYANLLKIQVERDRLKDRLRSTRQYLDPARAALNTAMNRPPRSPLPIPRTLPERALDLSYQQLTKQLETANPNLGALRAAAAGAESGVRLAKKNYYPDFAVGVDYVFTGRTDMPDVPDSGKDPLALKLSLQLPIWAKKNRAAVKEARNRHSALEEKGRELRNQLLVRLEKAYYRYRDAEGKMALYKETLLPNARQALEVTRSAFEAGNADFLDFIDSQRTLLAFQLAYEEAQTRRAQRLAEIHMLAGTPAGPKKETSK